jgi:hypothetical protein
MSELDEHLIAASRALAESHPLAAAQQLAKGIANQTAGAKLATLDEFVRGLLRGDRTMAARIERSLHSITHEAMQ